MTRTPGRRACAAVALWVGGLLLGAIPAVAAPVAVVNPGFEDVSGQSPFNEFTFGQPAGWVYYDPSAIIGSPGVFTGTLEPNGVEFFSSVAPEGVKVSILFNDQREGEGEYGYEQALVETLQADTLYELTVEVGNIASGTATNGSFFNLDEFPGYRVELLAGGVVVAEDDDSLSIPEGEFATARVTLVTGDADPQLGQALGIRLVNLNAIPAGYTQGTSPDLEVDFDDVALEATPLPEPAALFAGLTLVAGLARRRSPGRVGGR